MVAEPDSPNSTLKYRLLVQDIDGVLTDGTALLGTSGEEVKRIAFHDLDAVTRARQSGLKVVLVSGESGPLVQALARRFGVEEVVSGARDKAAALKELAAAHGLSLSEVCYVGDSDRDAPALEMAGLGLAPAGASPKAKRAAGHVLTRRGGEGAVAEAVELLMHSREIPVKISPQVEEDPAWLAHAAARIENAVHENILAHQQLLEGSIPTLVEIAATIGRAIQTGKKILLFGNGGSAADAQHVAADLLGSSVQRQPWPAIALTTDTSVLTALANDTDFEQVFARQVQALARPGDVVVGNSTSGRSRNVLLGMEAGRQLGATTVAFSGGDPGPLRDSADLCFSAPAQGTHRIQELHLVAWHAICDLLEQRLPGTEGWPDNSTSWASSQPEKPAPGSAPHAA